MLNSRINRICGSRSLLHGLAMLLALMLGSGSAWSTSSINLVQNGGFETGDFTGWTQGGNYSQDYVWPAPFLDPHSGAFAGDFGAPAGTSYISQELPTQVNHVYEIDFWLKNVQDITAGPAVCKVTWGSETLLDLVNPGSFDYTEFHFEADSQRTPATTLKFEFGNVPDWFRLDDVSVNQVSQGVPDQGSGICTTALVFLGLCGWRFRNRPSALTPPA